MKRSELKAIIREVIEEGKKNLDGPGSYTTPVEVGEFTITGWGRDTNGNSVIKYSFIEDGKEKNKSSQLGGLIGPLNDSEYKDREKGPGKKLIAAFKEAIDKEWISIPKRLKGKKVEESRVLSRRRIVQEAVQTPKSLRKVAAKIKKIVTDNYPDIMSLDDLPVPLQNKLEAEADHELFWQDANRYIGDLYSELGR